MRVLQRKQKVVMMVMVMVISLLFPKESVKGDWSPKLHINKINLSLQKMHEELYNIATSGAVEATSSAIVSTSSAVTKEVNLKPLKAKYVLSKKKKLALKRRKERIAKRKAARARRKMLKNGIKKYVPKGYGKVHSFMAWSTITNKETSEYKLRMRCEHYNAYGVGQVGSRLAVAVKPYYGNIGDDITVIQEDGIEYDCIIVEHKADENKEDDGWLSAYVHYDNSVVEFVVARSSWYNTGRQIKDVYPEYCKNIKKIVNTGRNINLKK